ncbi:MAG: hypothetical protein KIS63_00875 [Caldilineales bacterium]|nr:hypothetical protein [Caldilineales bacterium]
MSPSPSTPQALTTGEDIFSVIRRRNLLLYHPYDSFSPVVDLLQAAATPTSSPSSRQLYRVGKNAPVVQALKEARENGKQVAVLVELKARFDERRAYHLGQVVGAGGGAWSMGWWV